MASEGRAKKLEKRRRQRHHKRDKNMEEIQKAIWERRRRDGRNVQDVVD